MVSAGPPRAYEPRQETPLNVRACRYQLEALERAMKNLNGGSIYDVRDMLTLDW